jgi:hypothetical protein
VRTEVPGGALVLGGSYTAFLDFDHVTQAIRVLSFGPDSWAFALYSTTTMVDIEVVEDTPSTSEVTVSISFTRANDGSPRLTLNWNSTDTQRWQVETSTNLSQWSPLGGPVVSTVGANSVSLPYAQETGRFFSNLTTAHLS